MNPIFDSIVEELGNPRFIVMLPVCLAETLIVQGREDLIVNYPWCLSVGHQHRAGR